MRRRWLAIGLALAALTIGALACSSSKTPSPGGQTQTQIGSAQSEVTVTLVEYQLKPNVTSVPTGSVKFSAKNIGGTDHTLLVIKTDLAADALPKKGDGSVDESSSGITVVGKTDSIPALQQKSLTVNLAPGDYVLICNIVQTVSGQTISHYAKGMRTKFTITQ